MSCTAAWNQKAFRGRNDDGNETTATWKANQSTNWSQAKDTNFRVRFEVQETAGCAGANKVWQLQYNKNSAGWVTVNGSSSNVRSSASPNIADAANLTNQLTAGTGTFIGATGFDEVDGAAGGAAMDVAASGHSEAEFCVQIRSAEAAGGDTIQLRITDNGSAFAAYDATPSITVSSGNVTVATSTATLTLTSFAPTVSTPRLVTPTTLSLTLATFSPVVTTTSNATATPSTLSLVIDSFTPDVATPQLATPSTATLTLTAFAATAEAPAVCTPDTASLTISALAPTVSIPSVFIPGVASLSLETFPPTVSVPEAIDLRRDRDAWYKKKPPARKKRLPFPARLEDQPASPPEPSKDLSELWSDLNALWEPKQLIMAQPAPAAPWNEDEEELLLLGSELGLSYIEAS
jgi:hypothetical protein